MGRQETRLNQTMAKTTEAVTKLREATAVATSTPWLNARRAAMWLDAIINAMSKRVRNAVS